MSPSSATEIESFVDDHQNSSAAAILSLAMNSSSSPSDTDNGLPPGNGSSSTGGGASQDAITLAEQCFYLGSGSLGAFFNAIVLYIAIRYIDFEDKPRQIIVLCMSAADFLFCMSYVVTRPFLAFFPVWSCHTYYITIWTAQLCSLINLLWLNLDKLLYIQFPLHYYQIVTRRRVIILSVMTILLMTALSLFVNYHLAFGTSCTSVQLDPSVYLTIYIFYVVVIICSFACSAVIFCIANASTRLEPAAQSLMLRRLLFLFSSTLCTFITCLPYRLLYLTYLFCPECVWGRMHFRTLTTIFFYLLVIGSVINPVLTIVTQLVYRSKVAVAVRSCLELCCRRRGQSAIQGGDGILKGGPIDYKATSNRKPSTRTVLESVPLNDRYD